MAKVTIGNTLYEVEELSFLALEKAWPFIEEVNKSLNPITAVGTALNVIAAGLVYSDNFKLEPFSINESNIDQLLNKDDQYFTLVSYYLKRQMKASQIAIVRKGFDEIIEEAGLSPKEGEELQRENPLTPSTETGILSSPSSSQPDAREEAGTA